MKKRLTNLMANTMKKHDPKKMCAVFKNLRDIKKLREAEWGRGNWRRMRDAGMQKKEGRRGRVCDRVMTKREGENAVCQDSVCLCLSPEAQANISCIKWADRSLPITTTGGPGRKRNRKGEEMEDCVVLTNSLCNLKHRCPPSMLLQTSYHMSCEKDLFDWWPQMCKLTLEPWGNERSFNMFDRRW